ncbi:hypothetical protein [Lysinibacter sp. HNR]|uniref:hypothetical protein n=1 Tax=Lysinibacter sp. HNR TaxID=3031408 RepID=UPI002434C7B4|nr:hypothetical protein [Lysinibacter sp. HNR]WGD37613.1 hypothetical protein FrondiHNR_01455 [Lysinibacter sp. HNR]
MLVVFFLIPGVAMASWVTRTPTIRDEIGPSFAEMAIALFGLSPSSLLGVLGSRRLVARFGTKCTSVIGLWFAVASLVMIPVGNVCGSAVVVATGLGLFGLGMGICEIAINIDGAEVERLLGRLVMYVLQVSYSLGLLIGARAGFGLNALNVPVSLHLPVLAGAIVPAIFVFQQDISRKLSVRHVNDEHNVSHSSAWRDYRLFLIGLLLTDYFTSLFRTSLFRTSETQGDNHVHFIRYQRRPLLCWC